MKPVIPFVDWLAKVLTYGESELPGALRWDDLDDAPTQAICRDAFEHFRLDVAGPLVEFDWPTARAAAPCLAAACWRAVSQGDGNDHKVTMAGEPRTPSEHLSADLTLRFLATIYRRARVRNPDDALVSEVEAVLRRWPLSGALANIEAPPASGLEFAGHEGLQLLYAERLIDNERLTWMPPSGATRERVALIYHERGRSVPKPVVKKDHARE